MPTQKLKDFLDKEAVKYVTVQHSPAFTMSEIAHAAHLPGRMVAKAEVATRAESMRPLGSPATRRSKSKATCTSKMSMTNKKTVMTLKMKKS